MSVKIDGIEYDDFIKIIDDPIKYVELGYVESSYKDLYVFLKSEHIDVNRYLDFIKLFKNSKLIDSFKDLIFFLNNLQNEVGDTDIYDHWIFSVKVLEDNISNHLMFSLQYACYRNDITYYTEVFYISEHDINLVRDNILINKMFSSKNPYDATLTIKKYNRYKIMEKFKNG